MENFLTRKFGIKTWILQGYKQNQKEKGSIILTLKFNQIKVVKLFKINLLQKKNSFIILIDTSIRVSNKRSYIFKGTLMQI